MTPTRLADVSVEQAVTFFKAQGRTVVTFVGYSGAEYEQPAQMLERAGRMLDRFDPKETLVNIGATAAGIGAVYALAKQRGFETTGVVSSRAKDASAVLSPGVDHVFYVADFSWGGLLPGTTTLSPTSEAMVRVSDVMIGIGGGDIARDELLAARHRGKRVRHFAADMNHRLAIDKAAVNGLPLPTDFGGSACAALLKGR